MPSFLSFWSNCSFWERVELSCTLLVVGGVIGEFLLIFKHFPYNPTNFGPIEKRKKLWEASFAGLVAIGVAGELFAMTKALPESHKQIAALQLTNAWLWQSNLVLQSTIMQTSSNVLWINANKELVTEVSALVEFDIPANSVTMTNLVWEEHSGPHLTQLIVRQSNLGAANEEMSLYLFSDKFEKTWSPVYEVINERKVRRTDASMWTIRLEMEWFPFGEFRKGPLGSKPVGKVLRDLDIVVILPGFLSENTEILDGFVILTINGVHKKNFEIPKQLLRACY